MTPAGYIELKNGRSRFVPVIDPARVVALLGAALAVAGAVARPRLGGAGHQRDRRWRRR